MNETKNKPLSSSLRFPANSLESCLNYGKVIFKKHSNGSFNSKEMALDMGFSITSSSANLIMASLKYYGIIEKDNDETFRLSNRWFNHYLSENLKAEDLLHALHSVPVNKKIFSTYDIDFLSNINEIKSFLIVKCGYSLKQANNYIPTFSQNFSFYLKYKKMETSTLNSQIQHLQKQFEPAYETAKQLDLNLKDILDEKVNTIAQNMVASTISYPLSSNQQISIQLPDNLKSLSLEDLEDIQDILGLVLKKVSQQIDKKKPQNI